jgi:alcohol dehydrogenase YqhD (iron-dependent ADH family)
MWAGNLSHNSITGLGNVGGFICHPMQHEVSAMFDVTHGANLAVLWLAWAKYVYERDIDRFVQYAINVWDIHPNTDRKTAALEGIRKTEAFFRKLKMPVNNRELGIGTLSEAQITRMAEHVTSSGKKTLGAKIKLDIKDITNIYRMTNG